MGQLVALVGLEAVLREAVLIGEDRDRARAELGGGAEGTHRDLATVGNQNLLEHVSPRGGWEQWAAPEYEVAPILREVPQGHCSPSCFLREGSR